MSNQDRLLSDEELTMKIVNFVYSGLSLEEMNSIPKWLLKHMDNNTSELKTFIDTQKRLYAESVIGSDCQGGHDDWEVQQQCDIENKLRAEQRARIK